MRNHTHAHSTQLARAAHRTHITFMWVKNITQGRTHTADLVVS
jgi:hypothetical protein